MLLYNIQTLINIYIEKNKDKEGNENTDLKNKIINLLKEAFNEEIKRVKKLFEEDKNLWKSSYDSLNKAYDQYVKSIEKKMNDLITLPFVLVPVNITNFYEEVPQNLKANLIKEQSLKSCLLSLIIIHDIIYNIQKDTKNMIKSQRFPIAMSGARFGIGKEVPKSELGDEYAHCQLIDENDNNRNMKAEVIITPHVLYLAHIKGDDFDNFSEVKIFKKIPLRYLIIKVPSRIDNVLQLSDSSIEESNRKFIMVDCINSDNTARMFNYLVQMKKNCLVLEYSLFNSFIDDLARKVNNNETN